MAKIENHKYSIEEAFRECFYIVPDYQREYVWTDKEVQQLLDDINEQIDSSDSREYFIGTVLVSPTSEKNHYEVIDGQQRLTTFFLLLCALKQRFSGEPQVQAINGLISMSYTDFDGNARSSLKLTPRYEGGEEVIAKVVELNASPQVVRAGIQSAGIKSFGSLENLVTAYETIHRFLADNYEKPADLRKYWGYLANNVVFIQILTDVGTALKIFETINERGVGLNPMDLLKNLLFTHVQESEFAKLKDEWKKITAPLEQVGEKPLRFLRYFLMANYSIKNDRGDGIVREDEIYDWFVSSENAALTNYKAKPFELVRKIVRDVNTYLAFVEGRGLDSKPSLPMDSLKRLCGGAFSLHYVLLLAASQFPTPLFEHLVTQLESFLFYYIFTKTPTKELERNFSVWADELRSIGDISNAIAQREKLNEFLADRFQKSMSDKESELDDALRWYTLYSMQQYRTRYLLAKLTQYVDMAYRGVKTPGSLQEYAGLEIEHILPNNPEADLRAAFPAEDPNVNYDEYKVRLGNLTLLEKPINIVASNSFCAEKLPEYRKCRHYLTSSIAELNIVGQNTSITRVNQRLRSFDLWNATSINARHTMLLALAHDIWKITPIQII